MGICCPSDVESVRRRFLVVFPAVLMLFLISSNYAFSATESVVNYNNNGMNALKTSNYPVAVAAFQQCLKLDPSYKLAKENLAICFNNWGISLQGSPAQAIEKFHKSLFYSPDNATAVQNLEVTIQNLGKDPRSFKDRVALGKAARLAGDLEGGIVEFAEALKLKDDPALRVELGNAYYVRDRVDDAINQYNIAAKNPQLDPDVKAKVYRSLGQAYQAKGDYPHSVEAYKVAISLNGTDKETLEANKAVWLDAVKKDPTNPSNHVALGQAYMYIGDFDGSEVADELRILNRLYGFDNRKIEERLAGISESTLEVMQKSCIAEGEKKQHQKCIDEAFEEFDKALMLDKALRSKPARKPNAVAGKLDTISVRLWMNLATVYLAQGDYLAASKYYEKILEIHRDSKPANEGAIRIMGLIALIEQAKAKQASGDYISATNLYLRALDVVPENAELNCSLADCYFKQRNLAEAQGLYLRAVRKNPKQFVEKLFVVGAIQERLNCKHDALLTYQKYVAQSNNSENVAKAKKRIEVLEKKINGSSDGEDLEIIGDPVSL